MIWNLRRNYTVTTTGERTTTLWMLLTRGTKFPKTLRFVVKRQKNYQTWKRSLQIRTATQTRKFWLR